MSIEVRTLLLLLKHRRLLVGELASLVGVPAVVVEGIIRKHYRFIAVKEGEVYVLKPVELALELVNRGVELARISEFLSWKDFEEFSAYILEETGYLVARRVMLTTPIRLEVDVFGVEPVSRVGVAIDCKHWSIATESRLVEAARKHSERVAKLLRYYSYVKSKYRVLARAKLLVPAIVTLFTPPVRVYENVIMFSIREMPQALRDLCVVLEAFEIKPIKVPDT